jgi:hypothetical protein
VLRAEVRRACRPSRRAWISIPHMSPYPASPTGAEALPGSAALDPPRMHTGAPPGAPPYSLRANVIVAFFGGVYAILLFSFLNSRRLGRARSDAPLAVAIALAWTVAILVLSQAAGFGGLSAFALPAEQPRDFRLLSRVASLAVCGVLYLRLRPLYLSRGPTESETSVTFKAGLLALLAGTGLTLLVGFIGLSLR